MKEYNQKVVFSMICRQSCLDVDLGIFVFLNFPVIGSKSNKKDVFIKVPDIIIAAFKTNIIIFSTKR